MAGSITCAANQTATELEQAAVDVLESAYPDVSFRSDEPSAAIRTYAANQRQFTVYRLDRVGDWQAPRVTTAPDRGGISVRFQVKPVAYSGPMIVPHRSTTDLHVFMETIVVRNSADGKSHIRAEILMPRVDSPDELRPALVDLFLNFDRYDRSAE